MRRKAAFAIVLLFSMSTAFPIVASVIDVTSQRVLGYLDVCIAVILVVLSIYLIMKRKDKKIRLSNRLFNIYKAMASIPLVLMVIYFLDLGIKWDILLIGLAWRFWLISFILSDLMILFKKRKQQEIIAY